MEKTRKWKHKETGQIYKVLPWWESAGELIDADSARKVLQTEDVEPDDWPERMYRVGVLIQVGWLMENDNGIWVGVGPQAAAYFEEVRND